MIRKACSQKCNMLGVILPNMCNGNMRSFYQWIITGVYAKSRCTYPLTGPYIRTSVATPFISSVVPVEKAPAISTIHQSTTQLLSSISDCALQIYNRFVDRWVTIFRFFSFKKSSVKYILLNQAFQNFLRNNKIIPNLNHHFYLGHIKHFLYSIRCNYLFYNPHIVNLSKRNGVFFPSCCSCRP